MLASDLEVHREQLGDKGDYFGVDDVRALSDLMLKHLTEEVKVEYQKQGERREVLQKPL